MAQPATRGEGLSVFLAVLQCFFISGLFYLWTSPVLQPLKLMVVLFHELSHGLMAILSGGRVLSILVTADEGGACETEGGVGFLIVGAGYLGSMFIGGVILYLSRFKEHVAGVFILLTTLLGVAIVTVLHDDYSRTFATGLAAVFLLHGLLFPAILGALVMRLLGTMGCLYSILDIYWDILARDRPMQSAENDAVAFSQLTGIAPEAVGLAWLGFSTVYFLCMLRLAVMAAPPQKAQAPTPAKASKLAACATASRT